jgi:hypothetical protein
MVENISEEKYKVEGLGEVTLGEMGDKKEEVAVWMKTVRAAENLGYGSEYHSAIASVLHSEGIKPGTKTAERLLKDGWGKDKIEAVRVLQGKIETGTPAEQAVARRQQEALLESRTQEVSISIESSNRLANDIVAAVNEQ